MPELLAGLFGLAGVVIGWLLNTITASLQNKPRISSLLIATNPKETVDSTLRTSTSNSDLTLRVFNTGKTPIIIHGIELIGTKLGSVKQTIITSIDCGYDSVIVQPFDNKDIILSEQDSIALKDYCAKHKKHKYKIICCQPNGKKKIVLFDISGLREQLSLLDTNTIVAD